MSLTKSQPGFDRMMEEARGRDELLDDRYAEELYLNRMKGRIPVDDEQPEEKPKPAATVAQQPRK